MRKQERVENCWKTQWKPVWGRLRNNSLMETEGLLCGQRCRREMGVADTCGCPFCCLCFLSEIGRELPESKERGKVRVNEGNVG
jgi:hypothetical protein